MAIGYPTQTTPAPTTAKPSAAPSAATPSAGTVGATTKPSIPVGTAVPTFKREVKLQPPSTLIMGAPGAGKTTCIITYLLAGIEVFVVSLEPGGVDSLLDACAAMKAPIDKLHWMTVLPSTTGWSAIDAMTNSIGTMDFEMISKQKGLGKDQTRMAAMNFLNALKDFRCERTGLSYGDFTKLNDKQALVIDGLTGLSTIAWYLTVGYKPTGAPGEWNIAQNWLQALLLKINSDRNCFFTLTAHVEKEPNEITGVNQIITSTLGKKLAPKIPQFFGDVLYATRTKDQKFKWSNIDNNVDLKNRALPVSDNLDQDFGPVVKAYEVRKASASQVPSATTQAKPTV